MLRGLDIPGGINARTTRLRGNQDSRLLGGISMREVRVLILEPTFLGSHEIVPAIFSHGSV